MFDTFDEIMISVPNIHPHRKQQFAHCHPAVFKTKKSDGTKLSIDDYYSTYLKKVADCSKGQSWFKRKLNNFTAWFKNLDFDKWGDKTAAQNMGDTTDDEHISVGEKLGSPYE